MPTEDECQAICDRYRALCDKLELRILQWAQENARLREHIRSMEREIRELRIVVNKK
jgi:hypothetical protein